jgi:hypothetical protein
MDVTSLISNQNETIERLILPTVLTPLDSINRSLQPFPGALSYAQATPDNFYLGDGTDWVEFNTSGAQGPTGATGSPGNNATNFSTHWGTLQWTLVDNTAVNVPSGSNMPWNNSLLSGSGVTYPSAFLGLQVSNTGYYLVSFTISNIQPSDSNNMPYSFSLVINGSIGSALPQYTLQWRQDPTARPDVIYYQEGPASLTCIMALTTGQSVNVYNSTSNSFAINFVNAASGYTVSGILGSIAASLTIMQIS